MPAIHGCQSVFPAATMLGSLLLLLSVYPVQAENTLRARQGQPAAAPAMPNVPEPRTELQPRILNATGGGTETALEQNTPQPTPRAPVIFPRSSSQRYWISGQSNAIFQAHPAFHSPYEGAHSFLSRGEYKASVVNTLFLGYRPHRNLRYNTDLILDFESAGGRGLSQALGLAGFTNLDVVRNPSLGAAPYLARVEIHQTIGLTSRMVAADRDPFDLAPRVPLRRFDLRVGTMSLPDSFDVNPVGSDSHSQFTDWTIDNNGAWDYAADTRGYTTGGILEYDDRHWSARYGIFAMPTVANGIDLDWAFSRAHAQDMEFELDKSFIPGQEGATRILSFVNDAHMGSYREAVQAYFRGTDPVPDITRHEHFGIVKYGFGWNNYQTITPNLRIFSRFGWNEGEHESFVYTEVDQTFALGGDYVGTRWNRPLDKFGIAFNSNAIKKDHQNYLKYGGLGFILGDGHLNYGREQIVESYYNAHLWTGVFAALGLTHIDNPGYNRDRGPVWVPWVRTHIDW